jgi:hypothetical protein
MKRLLLLVLALALGLQAQTKLDLNQIAGCAITSTTPASTPIIIAVVATPGGTSQFACYTLAGVTVNAATATAPASITFPTTVIPTFVGGETPGGLVNGANTGYTLANAPAAGSLMLFRNGLLQQLGASADYTLVGGTVTFGAAPQTGDILVAYYRAS